MCGLKIQVNGDKVLSIKGDKQDPLSQGHICPKAVALQDLYTDKDRLTKPVKKTKNGWQTISWKEAFKIASNKINSIQTSDGNDAIGVYQGNPTVHNLEAMIYASDFFRQLRTKNRYTATSVDQLPHHLASILMFGHPLLIPIPDIDRTEYMIILGANPVVSNGSMMTVPNVKKRLLNIQKRGGKVVTIDPRKTETSNLADKHLFIKPGTDALLLMSMLNYLINKQLVNCNQTKDYLENMEGINDLVETYTPEVVAKHIQIEANQIKSLVDDFCRADSAVLYARIGVSTHEFGSLVMWLVNLFNILTGNFDSEGGVLFTKPAIDLIGDKRVPKKQFARYHSRVKQYPETVSEFPVATLADEILTSGKGQIKAMIVAAGNPLLSTPNNSKLTKAFEQLDFMLSIDFYINETSKHADIILPPPTPLERDHYDLVFNHLAVRNYAKYSKALFKKRKGSLSESEIYRRLIMLTIKTNGSKLKTMIKLAVMKWLGLKGIVNKGLKSGPYGKSGLKLNLKKLLNQPHGMDLGALEPCCPERLKTENKKIQLTPQEFIKDLERLKTNFESLQNTTKQELDFPFKLIGRRDPRTCNSWMHNSYRLVKGKPACIAHMNPVDANNLGIQNGALIKVSSKVGEVCLPVELTETILSGVISIPHGWGHGINNTQISIANAHPGVSVNQLTDDSFIDQLSGNTALNAVPVDVVLESNQH